MIFADADVLALEGGPAAPPLEVRLGLQPGDKVGLYQETRHASMGSGYVPIEAVILGSMEPGWFVGETEDGQQIQFHAGNIADVELGSPSMGGVFDWFKKKPTPPPSIPVPGSVISLPSGPQAPGTPSYQPPPAESKGLISKLRTFFAPSESAEKKSVFDYFKKEPPKSGLPVVKESSMFAFLKPGEKAVVPWSKAFQDVALPKGPTFLAPYLKKIEEVFKIIPASPPPGPPQKELWEGMFEKPTEAEKAKEQEKPISDIFKMFTPAEVQPATEVIPPSVPQRMHRSMKILPIPQHTALFPTVEDVARGFIGLYNPIDELWDMLRAAREKPAWKKYIEKYGFAKERWETIGTCGGPPTIFEELSALLHIPWEEFRKRAEIVDHGDEGEEWVGDDDIWMDIVFPATEIMTEALELIKPPDLVGHFGFEREEHHMESGQPTFCMLVMTYTEGEEKEGAFEEWKKETGAERVEEEMPPLDPSVYEQWKEENSAESPEEIIAQLQKDDIAYEQALAQMEREIGQLVGDINTLDKGSGTFQEMFDELRSQVEYRKELIQGIHKLLSEGPPEPEAKRAPSTKPEKPAKRGKKRKK